MKIFFTAIVCLCNLGIIYSQQYQPIDNKSSVTFAIKNFGVKTGGSFTGLAGLIEFDKASPDKVKFDISIDAATVNTDNSTRDGHLRKEEYFDTEKCPRISFKSLKTVSKGNGFVVSGKLTIKETTKDISFPFTASAKDDGYLFEGSFKLNRRDYKIGGNSMVLGDEVAVTLSVFASKK